MRKLVVCNLVSVDGYFAGPRGDLSVMPFDRGFSEYNAERLRAADTLVLGRETFEMFRAYWPAIASDDTQPEVEREISRMNGAIEKVVVSNTLGRGEVEGWGPEIAALKRRPGRDVLVFGSHVLWNDLLALGLVDELHLLIGAGVLGEGIRAFESRPPCRLRLLETRGFDGSSLLSARYAVKP
jgi:dihydrofolate reductase